jgi:hypothetical protein
MKNEIAIEEGSLVSGEPATPPTGRTLRSGDQVERLCRRCGGPVSRRKNKVNGCCSDACRAAIVRAEKATRLKTDLDALRQIVETLAKVTDSLEINCLAEWAGGATAARASQ